MTTVTWPTWHTTSFITPTGSARDRAVRTCYKRWVTSIISVLGRRVPRFRFPRRRYEIKRPFSINQPNANLEPFPKETLHFIDLCRSRSRPFHILLSAPVYVEYWKEASVPLFRSISVGIFFPSLAGKKMIWNRHKRFNKSHNCTPVLFTQIWPY